MLFMHEEECGGDDGSQNKNMTKTYVTPEI